MKDFVYWMMGDRTGRIIVATWNWLWGMPVETNSDIATGVAQASLDSMQQSVVKLTQAAATVVSAHQQALEIFVSKQKEFKHAESQALLAHRKGNVEATRMAMAHAFMIEGLLPQLQERVTHAEQLVIQTKEKLTQEHQRLATYKIQMHNLNALAEVNKALNAIAQTTSDLGLDNARSQFETAEAAIKRQHYKGKAYADLSVNPTEKLKTDLDRLTLDDQIAQRFQQLTTPGTLPEENKR
jgi:phage shock protein A